MPKPENNPTRNEIKKLREDVNKLKATVKSLEHIVSQEPERKMAPVISALGSRTQTRRPTLEEVLKRLRQHQIQVHGKEDPDLFWTCDDCFTLEAFYTVLAKAEGVEIP